MFGDYVEARPARDTHRHAAVETLRWNDVGGESPIEPDTSAVDRQAPTLSRPIDASPFACATRAVPASGDFKPSRQGGDREPRLYVSAALHHAVAGEETTVGVSWASSYIKGWEPPLAPGPGDR
jgi:hypothetical protein